jgi:hypothetical protein
MFPTDTSPERRSLLRALALCLGSGLAACASAVVKPAERAADLPAWLVGVRVRFEPLGEFAPPFPGRPGERYGNRILLRGRLEWRGAAQQPWSSQPLLIALATKGNSEGSWDQPAGSRWMRQWDNQRGVIFGAGHYVLVECQLESDGQFFGSVPVRLLERSLDRTEDHLIALALPNEDGGAEVLAATEQRLALPSAARHSLTQSRIAAVVAPGQGIHDPLALVRAVNHLRLLGRDGALTALEEFVARLGQEEVWVPRDPKAESPETGSPGAVFPILQLLFEPLAGRPPAPPYSLGTLEARPRPPLAPWPSYPLYLVSDWPFLMGDFAALRSAPDSDARRQIDWAREHGRVRPLPLVPSAEPLAVLGELEARSGLPGGNRPRLQAYRSLTSLLALPPLELANESTDRDLLGQLVQAMAGLKPRWDGGAQTLRLD